MRKAEKRPQQPSIEHIAPVSNLEEKIRLRAYELYELRSREDGHDLDDWLRAEKEFMEKRRSHVALA